ncbi:hypothetical protein Harman_12280 [Haloarcula mannanilytica]|uniref:Uncharacterized protein n=1 Tax=Haloarcula mannanilytica TaxID=2509225 RepID=A0A4C2EL03_9EURY|nr:hypothetical protein Harman_12280 [Haloarcula mannanilytica]
MGRGHPFVQVIKRRSFDARVGNTGKRGSDIDVHTGGVGGVVQTTPGGDGGRGSRACCHRWPDNTALNHALA